MSAVSLRLNPAFPMCWESPLTLRFGFDRAHARLPEPSAAVQRLVLALKSGVSAADLAASEQRFGVSAHETTEVLQQLAAVLEEVPAAGEAASVMSESMLPPPILPEPVTLPVSFAICDTGRAVRTLRDRIAASDVCSTIQEPLLPETPVAVSPLVTRGKSRSSRPGTRRGAAAGSQGAAAADAHSVESGVPEIVIVVERFLAQPERVHRWLTAGVRHLPLRFTDEAVYVGPVISENGAPCHSCLALHLVDDDPAIGMLAAQLMGKTPASEVPAATALACWCIEVLVRAWADGAGEASEVQAVFPVRNGMCVELPTLQRVTAHPECGCVALNPERYGAGAANGDFEEAAATPATPAT